ncbi:hypothetical protein M3J09_001441 [Ascochyta lentis]
MIGDKVSLQRYITDATRIPHTALHNTPLSRFSVDEKFSWREHRQTKVEEDKAYCMMGIFGVSISPFYGEGAGSAFKRLREQIQLLEKCIQDIRLTDPRDDKTRIEQTKGGLLDASCRWAIESPQFQRWRNNSQNQLLWIEGDAGKGRTMLLFAIVDELKTASSDLISFFFFQGTDSRINSATAALRGLIYLLIDQDPFLAKHVRVKSDTAGRSVFEDANAWYAMSEMLTKLLNEHDRKPICLIVDALDECVSDLPKLLDLIVSTSTSSNRIKWLLSSRHEMHVKQKLKAVGAEKMLSLELKENAEQVSRAVDSFIDKRLSTIGSIHDDSIRYQVRDILRRKANGTFLWAALVIQELEKPENWDPLNNVEEAPLGLYQLYDCMMDKIQRLSEKNSKTCRTLLSIARNAYRPLYLDELCGLCRLPIKASAPKKVMEGLVAMCGSFLTIRKGQVYLIHQSARDYLCAESQQAFLMPIRETHDYMFAKSVDLMSRTLRRDIYDLKFPGVQIEDVETPTEDPLASVRYSCIHWINHFSGSMTEARGPKHVDVIYKFLEKKYLYWLEALSLCKDIPAGATSIRKLEVLLRGMSDSPLTQLVYDARRTITYYQSALQTSPLQVYASVLLFSPTKSLFRKFFKHEEPRWVKFWPDMEDDWSPCLQTLEGHTHNVNVVAFSHDSKLLASASSDSTIRIWDVGSGVCFRTLSYRTEVYLLAFSRDSTQIASKPEAGPIQISRVSNGNHLHTLRTGNSQIVSLAFSTQADRIASVSSDTTVNVWDTSSGACRHTLSYPLNKIPRLIYVVALSYDVAFIACSPLSSAKTIDVWDSESGSRTQKLCGHNSSVASIAFSQHLSQLASLSEDGNIRIWDIQKGTCLHTFASKFEHTNQPLQVIAFSRDSTLLALGSYQGTIESWDVTTEAYLQPLKSHSSRVTSISFSHDSTCLASGSLDTTIKTWDLTSLKDTRPVAHNPCIDFIVFSPNGTLVSFALTDNTITVWDVNSTKCLQTLVGHTAPAYFLFFLCDPALLVSRSFDRTVRVWDLKRGTCLHTFASLDGRRGTLALSRSHPLLAMLSMETGTCLIRDIVSGRCVQALGSRFSDIFTNTTLTAFSKDSRKLGIACQSSQIQIWDVRKGTLLDQLHVTGHYRPLAFSLDLTLAGMTAIGAKGVEIWSVGSKTALPTIAVPAQFVLLSAFSANSALLATLDNHGGIKIWDTSNGECLQTLCKNTPEVRDLSFDATNSLLHTSIGTFDLSSGFLQPMSDEKESQLPRYVAAGLSPDRSWLMCQDKCVLWLPPDYRPYCTAVSGNSVTVGCASGRMLIVRIVPEFLP